MKGIWPAVWYHTIDTPSSNAFTKAFTQRWGKPPENQAWGDYNAMKILAQAMAETAATESDPLVGHLEKGAKFDVMKEREGYFRDWDHQLIMEMYTMTPKQPEEITDQWDIMTIGEAVPAADEPLDRSRRAGRRTPARSPDQAAAAAWAPPLGLERRRQLTGVSLMGSVRCPLDHLDRWSNAGVDRGTQRHRLL